MSKRPYLEDSRLKKGQAEWLQSPCLASQPRETVQDTLSWKKPSTKQSWWVAQVVEHKCEILSSNPHIAKKKE
jgi:hypothetical protein